MIKIEIENIESIKDKYLFELNKQRFNKKTGNIIQNYWIDDKDRIIAAKPEAFQNIINEFEALDQSGFSAFKTYMEGQYENRIDKDWLMSKLNIRTCPYCNRQYTFAINKGDIKAKPEFDHFYPKSKYPYLALSFYNLIPSCPTCNHIKGTKEIDKNPYSEEFGNDCKFVLKGEEMIRKGINKPVIIDKKNIEVDFSSDNKNIKVFGLKELYNEHTDYIGEIIDKAQAYNSTYYDSLIQLFRGLGKTPAEIDRYVWGNYLETAAHCKRPLSKLTRDVLEQIGIK